MNVHQYPPALIDGLERFHIVPREDGAAQGRRLAHRYQELFALCRSPTRPVWRTVGRARLYIGPLWVNVRFCRDGRFRLSQITWRTSVAHHPTEETEEHLGALGHGG